ncbi:MAG: 50S ribosomal protein L19e [Conexivisphaera sp.]|jgi:large subunit ribosomal protein L19e
MTNLSFQRELAAKVLGVGKGRIKFNPERLEDIEDAITREDIRRLHRAGAIDVTPVAGTSRGRARTRSGRRGPGSRKGTRESEKEKWMRQVRALRKTLRDLRKRGEIDAKLYRRLYMLVKGGAVRSRRRLMEIMEAERHAAGS